MVTAERTKTECEIEDGGRDYCTPCYSCRTHKCGEPIDPRSGWACRCPGNASGIAFEDESRIVIPRAKVAEILGVTVHAVFYRLRAGTIPYVDIPGAGRQVYAPAFKGWYWKQRELSKVMEQIDEATKHLTDNKNVLKEEVRGLIKRDYIDEYLIEVRS